MGNPASQQAAPARTLPAPQPAHPHHPVPRPSYPDLDTSRRAFVTALGMSLLAVPARALAQQAPRVPRVGYLFSFTPSAGRRLWEACQQGLRDLGYAEGRTELSGKRFQLLADALPSVGRVAVLTNPDNLSHVVFLEEARGAAQAMGIEVEPQGLAIPPALRQRVNRPLQLQAGAVRRDAGRSA